MPFRVLESGAATDKIVVLEDATTGTKAEIFAFGALLNQFSILHNGVTKNVIYGYENTGDAQQNITPLFQSAKLSPFVCRVKDGRYTFGTGDYKLEKYYYHNEALHGLLYDAVFTVIETGATNDFAFATLAYDYRNCDAGYPFFYRVEITYRLAANNRLTVATQIINTSKVSIPVADGWHPYFCLGETVNDLRLSINASSLVEFDNRLLPTGHFLPYIGFAEPQPVGDTVFDNCFALTENTDRPACTLFNGQSRLQLTVFAEKDYPYLQLFTPANRACIAIENLSSLPDSFNNGIGLIILEPAQRKDFIAVYQLSIIEENQVIN